MTNDVDTRSLTPLQASFLEHYVKEGLSVAEAAKAAGYSGPRAAYSFLETARGKRALQDAMLDALAHRAPRALNVMSRLAEQGKSEYVRQQAAADLLDRAGFKPPDRVDHRVLGDLSISIDLSGDDD